MTQLHVLRKSAKELVLFRTPVSSSERKITGITEAVSMNFDEVNSTKEADRLREESGGLSLQCKFTHCCFRS